MYDLLKTADNKDDAQLVIEIDETNYEEVLKCIKIYYNSLSYEKGYEGIMIKPDYIKPGFLSMMKCRNTSYLSIIYGYDYTLEPKFTRLIKSKTTSTKIKQSIKEFKLGIEMLKTNYNDINTDNEAYQKLLKKFLFNEEEGNKLDPRL